MPAQLGLIGDYNAGVIAHQAIALAVPGAAEALGIELEIRWVHTTEITDDAVVSGFDGLWCVPASPYQNTEGALRAIRFARENGVPFLGTCGGFQHAVIEYARNVWGMADAAHAETDPDAPNRVIVPLACSLVEARGRVSFVPGTRLAAIYNSSAANEGYHCSYGVSQGVLERMSAGPLRVSSYDDAGESRAIELADHPFYIATLFQPERRALRGEPNPLVDAFVRAVHSARSDSTGSTRTARRPGMYEAASAVTTSTSATAAKVTGSDAPTP